MKTLIRFAAATVMLPLAITSIAQELDIREWQIRREPFWRACCLSEPS